MCCFADPAFVGGANFSADDFDSAQDSAQECLMVRDANGNEARHVQYAQNTQISMTQSPAAESSLQSPYWPGETVYCGTQFGTGDEYCFLLGLEPECLPRRCSQPIVRTPAMGTATRTTRCCLVAMRWVSSRVRDPLW